VEKVKEKLSETWTMVKKTVPQLPESNTTSEPVEQIELIHVAWSELVEREEASRHNCETTRKKLNCNPRSSERKWRKLSWKGIMQEKPCTNGLSNAQRSSER
jgi:hypothetical protein